MKRTLTIIFASLGLFIGMGYSIASAGNQRQEICLNGEWEIVFQTKKSESIPKSGWQKMRVPSSWSSTGIRNYSPPRNNVKRSTRSAWYQHSFKVPAAWNDGRKVKLKFQLVEDAHKIFINGKEIFASDILRLCNEIDITNEVKFGKSNHIAVLTSRAKKFLHEAGIIRDVFLVSEPVVNIEYAHAMPSVADKKLCLRISVCNESKSEQDVVLNASVIDQGKTAISFPVQKVKVPANSSKVIMLEKKWTNPVLWGFGKYGKPYLYNLKTKLTAKNGTDIRFDRFGFREFKTSGNKFLFNGKPYFIKGDLLTRNFCFYESPAAAAAYYLRQRETNISFQRLHSAWRKSNFDNKSWYQVADEVGFLVEAQMSKFRSGSGIDPKRFEADSPEVKEAWEVYMREHFNHPSLVIWCIDNETFSVGLTSRKNLAKINMKELKAYDELSTFVRKYDPTRTVEINHNYSIYPFMKRGKFNKKNFMTFNIHPYGAIKRRVNTEAKAVRFDYSIPIIIGEIFTFPSKMDFLENPSGAYAEQWRIANSYYNQIINGAKAKGVAGEILCAIQADGFWGYKSFNQLYLGPWSDFAIIREQGKIVGIRDFMANISWPSLSGVGSKAEFVRGYGYGLGFNWFDPTVPMYHNNVADLKVKKAFKDVDGEAPPALQQRAPEVVVCIGDIQNREGTYVYLKRVDGEGPTQGVAADKNGTAWFRLWDTGKYLATCRVNGKLLQKKFEISARPAMTSKPGYQYITWVNLTGNTSAKIKKQLQKPATFLVNSVRRKGEALGNGDMEYWKGYNLSGWLRTPERSTDAKSGKYSALIKGGKGQIVRQISLQKGCTYLISGWVKKLSGKGTPKLILKQGHSSYKLMLSVPVDAKTGEWVKVEKKYLADGTEKYFYCHNSYMTEDPKVLYDAMSIKKIADAKSKKNAVKFSPGPHKVSKGGFIRDWLVCGPFPNRGNEEVGFEGHKTDWLKEQGGEKNIVPKLGDKVEVTFPDNFYWCPATVSVSWNYLNSSKNLVQLDGVQLPDLAISNSPSSNICAYLNCIVVSPDDRKVKLGIGSDDGYKIFLNKKQVGEHVECRGAAPDQEVYPVQLKKGENVLTIKLFQVIGGWSCYVHFLDNEGRPVKDIKIMLKGAK